MMLSCSLIVCLNMSRQGGDLKPTRRYGRPPAPTLPHSAVPHSRQICLGPLPDHSGRTDVRADDRLGVPATGLLAQIAVAKIDDHLPLHRQSEIYTSSWSCRLPRPRGSTLLEAQGVLTTPCAHTQFTIPRSSMAQWLGICGVRLEPLAAALKEFILGHAVFHADLI